MRILLVTPVFFPSLGGAAICFDTLSQEFARLDPTARVTVLTRTVRGSPRFERRGPVRVLRLLPAVRPGSGPTLIERGKATVAGFVILFVSLALRSDVVHYHTLASYRALHYLAPFFRAPLLADMRDLAALNEGASLRYYSRTRRLICASKNIVAFVRTRGVPDERTVHIPIPLGPFRSATTDEVAAARTRYAIPHGPYALFLGAILPSKGVRELVQAMALVWRRTPELRLVIAGPLRPEGDALFPGGLVTHLKSLEGIQYLGPVPHTAVPALLAGAELFILPSKSEGLPRSCLEAMALGTKVVLPPGIPEFDAVCPQAVLARITPDAIAEQIERARHDPPAQYPVEMHEAANVADLTLEVYRSVVGNASPTTARPRRPPP